MVTILLVEDEPIERKAMQRFVEHAYENQVKVTAVENGIEAIEVYKKSPFDIVFCDINMPGLNGLETIRELKKLNYETTFLIVTSYNYFEYAQEAIKLGVNDFILKPVGEKDIKRILQQILDVTHSRKSQKTQTTRLIKKIEETKPIIRSDCVYNIIQNKDSNQLKGLFNLLNITPKNCICMVSDNEYISFKQIRQLSNRLDEIGFICMCDNYYGLTILFIMNTRELIDKDFDQIRDTIKSANVDAKYFGISKIYYGCENFHRSYLEAIDKIGYSTDIQVEEEIHTKSISVYENIETFCDELIADFLREDTQILEKKISYFYLYLLYLEPQQILTSVQIFNKSFLLRFNREFKTKFTLEEKTNQIAINPSNPYENLHEQLLSFVQIMISRTNYIDQETSNKLAKKAMSFISLNFAKPITLKHVADHLGVSTFYLSKILNKNLSKNFTDLIMDLRIEKAKELILKETKVKEISGILGFQSQSYFGKVFKKKTGLSPSEFFIQHTSGNV